MRFVLYLPVKTPKYIYKFKCAQCAVIQLLSQFLIIEFHNFKFLLAVIYIRLWLNYYTTSFCVTTAIWSIKIYSVRGRLSLGVQLYTADGLWPDSVMLAVHTIRHGPEVPKFVLMSIYFGAYVRAEKLNPVIKICGTGSTLYSFIIISDQSQSISIKNPTWFWKISGLWGRSGRPDKLFAAESSESPSQKSSWLSGQKRRLETN